MNMWFLPIGIRGNAEDLTVIKIQQFNGNQ
jgi:hypothetical protein